MDKCFCAVEELSRMYVLPDKVKKLMLDLCERRKVRYFVEKWIDGQTDRQTDRQE